MIFNNYLLEELREKFPLREAEEAEEDSFELLQKDRRTECQAGCSSEKDCRETSLREKQNIAGMETPKKKSLLKDWDVSYSPYYRRKCIALK